MTPALPNSAPQPPGGGLNVQDILYVLFKHKWKIVLLSFLGFGAAAAVFFTKGENYESRAKLLVRYVHAYSNVDNWETQAQAGGRDGESIINTEVEILNTRDLALSVVDEVGVDVLLPEEEGEESATPEPAPASPSDPAPAGPASPAEAPESAVASQPTGGEPAVEPVPAPSTPAPTPADDRTRDPRRALAAKQILESLQVTTAKGSNVLHLAYQNQDPELVRTVLSALIEQYFHKHAATHRPVRKELAELETTYRKLDLDLKTLRNEIRTDQDRLREEAQGDTAASLEAQRIAVKSALLQTEADVAQQTTKVEILAQLHPEEARKVAGEKGDAAEAGPELALPIIPKPEPHVVQQFEESFALQRSLQMRKIALLETFTPEAPSVRNIEAQIKAQIERRERMLDEHPGLGEAAAAPLQAANGSPFDLNQESALLASLQTKKTTYQGQLQEIEGRFTKLSALEVAIAQKQADLLEQSKQWEELSASLKLAQVEKKITDGSLPNISILQHPTMAGRALDDKTKKITLALAAAGIGLGIGLAFLIEFVLDRRVKRPTEIEGRMRLPLMLSIPVLNGKGALRLGYEGNSGEGSEDGEPPLLPLGGNGMARTRSFVPYAEAIRDRLVYYFALNEMTHKPKMIALAGLSPEAGASTLAAGVATAFAKSEARVLLVDLSAGTTRSSSHLIARDKDASPSSGGSRNGAEIGFSSAGENLFVATMTPGNGNGLAALAPRKFYDLIPKFRSSDFDYIIFDMPPLSDTSPTSAMAAFMDKVLLVLDAENTDRGALKKSYAELMRGKADVACVFNKVRPHAPRWLLG